MNRLHDEIHNLNTSCEGKVDKQFIRNLVVGYFNAAADKKQDVARLLASILEFDFNEQEMKKARVKLDPSSYEHGHRRQNSTSSTASFSGHDESFAQQFVHFLEEESKVHRVQVAKQLAHDLTRVVSTPETTNLISKSTTSSATTQATKVDVTSANAGQQEVKPMLIPNSAIMNAQLSKLSLNAGNKASQHHQATSSSIQQQKPNSTNTTLSSLNQTPSSSNLVNSATETIKPIVLNFANPLNNDRAL